VVTTLPRQLVAHLVVLDLESYGIIRELNKESPLYSYTIYTTIYLVYILTMGTIYVLYKVNI